MDSSLNCYGEKCCYIVLVYERCRILLLLDSYFNAKVMGGMPAITFLCVFSDGFISS